MARISRKGQKQLEEFQPGEYRIYHVAQYVRLSKEDNGKDDSDSIENQIGLIQKYIQEKPYLFQLAYMLITDTLEQTLTVRNSIE